MSGRTGLLALVLAVQLIIVAAVLLADVDSGARQAGPLLNFEPDAVDEIRITAGSAEQAAEQASADEAAAETLVLARDEAGWRLPDGLPADTGKIDQLLQKLATLGAPWPVATSGSAAERFEVAEARHQRRLVLSVGAEVVADLYLGSSPGFQQVHARRADAAAVYSVGLSNYELPTAAGDWLDKTLLRPAGAVTAVSRPAMWTLERTDDGWQLDGAPADQDAAADLVRRLAELRVSGTAEAPAEGAAAVTLAVTDADGGFELSLIAEEEGSRFLATSSRRQAWFTLPGYLAEDLLVEAEALRLDPDAPADGDSPVEQDTAADEAGAEAPTDAAAPAEPPAG